MKIGDFVYCEYHIPDEFVNKIGIIVNIETYSYRIRFQRSNKSHFRWWVDKSCVKFFEENV